MTPVEIWRAHELWWGHIKPSTVDVIEWLMLVALPALFFILGGTWAWGVVAFMFARFLIPQWGVPTDLRWRD
jgi:hypothetical protein